MLRIDKDSAGLVTILRLSGRIQRSDLDSIRSAMDDIRTRKMLDLSDVTLVDVAVVQFLICYEDEGVELAQCCSSPKLWPTVESIT